MRETYKIGSEYQVGDTLEYGVVLKIWKHPKNKGMLVLFVENKGKYAGTYTFYAIPKAGIVGPTLYRFVSRAIVQEAYSLIGGKNTTTKPAPKKKVKAPVMETKKETASAKNKPSPMLKNKRTIPPLGSIKRKRKVKQKNG